MSTVNIVSHHEANVMNITDDSGISDKLSLTEEEVLERETTTITNHSFPFDIFPTFLQEKIKHTSLKYSFPAEVYGVLSLGAISAAIGNQYRIVDYDAKTTTISTPLSLYSAIIARSGMGKSGALRTFTEVLRVLNTANYIEDEKRYAEYLKEQDQDKSPPRQRSFVVSDYTPEYLTDALIRNPQGVVAILDELAQLSGDMSRYGGTSHDFKYCSLLSGGVVSIERKHQRNIEQSNTFLTIISAGTKSALKNLAAKNRLDSGFFFRFLLSIPLFEKVEKQKVKGLELYEIEYDEFIKKLYYSSGKEWRESNNKAVSTYIKFTYEASEILEEAKNALLEEVEREHEDNETIRSAFLRQFAYVERFAGICAIINAIDRNKFIDERFKIHKGYVYKALRLFRYFKQNMYAALCQVGAVNQKFSAREIRMYEVLKGVSDEFRASELIKYAKASKLLSESQVKRNLRDKILVTQNPITKVYRKTTRK